MQHLFSRCRGRGVFPNGKESATSWQPNTSQQGSKWFFEYHEGNRDLVVTDGTAKTSVCMVQCNKSLLQISNKINTVQVLVCCKRVVWNAGSPALHQRVCKRETEKSEWVREGQRETESVNHTAPPLGLARVNHRMDFISNDMTWLNFTPRIF